MTILEAWFLAIVVNLAIVVLLQDHYARERQRDREALANLLDLSADELKQIGWQ